MTETQQRFLRAISERIPVERIAEFRLYPTLRVGQVESGVAIVACEPAAPVTVVDAPVEVPSIDRETAIPEAPVADAPAATAADDGKLSILTAHFRLTVKGPDRGKWDFSIVHDADAPIETVESVVRGVARRAGEDGEPELLSGDDFQKALAEPWWTATKA